MRHRNDEEQSGLLLVGHTYKEPIKPSEAELTSQGIKAPVNFFLQSAERYAERGHDPNVTDNISYRHHVTNPNILNRASNFPSVFKSSLPADMKAEIVDVVVNCIEKHHFEEAKVANAIKVTSFVRTSISMEMVEGTNFSKTSLDNLDFS